MAKKFLVSTADVYGYDSSDNLLFTGKTMLDTSMEVSLQNQDVRAGQGNQLQYVFYHSPEMAITVNEAQFSLEFIALNAGTVITTGKDVWTEETVTVASGAGSVTGTPLAVQGTTVYGWVTIDEDTVERVTFSGSSFTLSDPTISQDVCVRYYANNAAARSVTIYADMLPSNIRLVLEAKLASSDSTTNQIGKVQIEVPKASMTGAFTLNMTPDSVSQTPLSIRVLASSASSVGCAANRPVYATISEIIDDANWYDHVIGLSIYGGDFSLEVGATETLSIYAVPGDGSAPFLAPVADLTFASSDDQKVIVSSAGVVTGVAAGSATVKVSITADTTIDANVVVTVTE